MCNVCFGPQADSCTATKSGRFDGAVLPRADTTQGVSGGTPILPRPRLTPAYEEGYQILGPYPCDKSFFRYCKAATASSKTGSTIYVGAPIGTAQALAVLLNGKAPPVNECRE